MNTQIMYAYLVELENNNERQWYHDNKAMRDDAFREFESLIYELIAGIREFDDNIFTDDPRSLTFKQVRDTRFSHDKSPYNPVLRAHLGPSGKLPVPVGYYLCIAANDRTFFGGGLFTGMFKEATTMIRDYIVKHGAKLEEILNAPEFKNYFQLKGEKLKNVPRGYDKEHPQRELLKYKSWYIEYFVDDAIVLDNHQFIALAVECFRVMKPFNDFLNQALRDFSMPIR